MSVEPRTLTDLETIFRRETRDYREPFFWSKEEVYEFANVAQIEACRRAQLITDSASKEVCLASYKQGATLVPLDQRIIHVRRALVVGQILPLQKVSMERMDRLYMGWEGIQEDMPIIWIPDHTTGFMRLYPTPLQDGQVTLTVVREPLASMCKPNDEPELPMRYRRPLVNHMLYLAYLKQESDTYDEDKAERAEARFTAEFGPPTSGRNERWAEDGITFPDALA